MQENSSLNGNLSTHDMSGSICSCGCGFEIGSLEFIRLHVETEEEQIQRESMERYYAEEEASQQLYEEEMHTRHPFGCNCPGV